MKIDIENYENLTPEEKIAALEANYTSVAQIKATADKNASEAASYKKQLREKQTDDEVKAAEREAKFAEIMAEVETLRHEKMSALTPHPTWQWATKRSWRKLPQKRWQRATLRRC